MVAFGGGCAYHEAMFVLAKVYNYLSDPGVWLPLLLAAGTGLLWTRWRRAGRWVVTVVVAVLILLAVLPVGGAMIAVLEERFPARNELAGPVDGIIALGGTIDQFGTKRWGQPVLTDGAERLTALVALARRFPQARLVFTGGSGSLTNQKLKEADAARLFFRQMGLDPTRIAFERRSRNTYENATLTYKLVSPEKGERWVLITSAAHMPRAMGVFRKAGWNPVAYPVDYQTRGLEGLSLGLNMAGGLNGFSRALREYTALLVYRVLGRTDALFPGPLTDG